MTCMLSVQEDDMDENMGATLFCATVKDEAIAYAEAFAYDLYELGEQVCMRSSKHPDDLVVYAVVNHIPEVVNHEVDLEIYHQGWLHARGHRC